MVITEVSLLRLPNGKCGNQAKMICSFIEYCNGQKPLEVMRIQRYRDKEDTLLLRILYCN